MFARSIRKPIQPQLRDDEALLAAVLAQAGGASAQLMAHALSPTGVALRADRATHEAHAHAAAAATEAVEAIGVETARGQPAEALPRALAEAHLPTSRVAA